MLGRANRKHEEKARPAPSRKALNELTRLTLARRLESPDDRIRFDVVGSRLLRPGDLVLALAEDMVPADGVVINGAARVDESALGRAAEPVLRSPAEGHEQVAAGTRVLAGWLVLRVTADARDCLLRRLLSGEDG